MKHLALLLAVLLLAGAVLPGVASSQSGELILRVAMQDDMKTTNPLTAGDVWTWNVLRYLYDGPVSVNPDTDEPMPYIAVGTASDPGDSVDWADCEIGIFDYTDNSTWSSAIGEAVVFYDFENVHWHDGEQMDIRDILFSFHVEARVPEWSSQVGCLKEQGGWPETNYSDEHWLNIYKVWESPDKQQAALKFRLTEPYADFFTETVSNFLLPYHVWGSMVGNQNVDDAKIWCDPDYDPGADDAWRVDLAQYFENPDPVGCGPFKFEEWEKGQYIKITTYRDHFFRNGFKYEDYCLDEDGNTLARQPNIDGIHYYIYKTAEAAVLALKNDDIDYIGWSVPPTFVQELTSEPGVALSQSPEPGFFYLAYNMRRPSFGYAENGTDIGKPLRQAIAHCIDKERMVQRILLNFGISGKGPVSELSEWYNESIHTYGFDPDKAKEILQNAGYIEPDWGQYVGTAENHWLNPDGSEIGSGENGLIKILSPPYPNDLSKKQTTPAWMIAAVLRDIGIYAEAVIMGFNSIIQLIGAPQYTSPVEHNFDMYVLGWRISTEPDDYLHAFFHSRQADYGSNYPGYNNESFDEIIELARQTEDPDIKLKAIQDAQASIVYDLPVDVLYFRTNIEAYRSDSFTGWEVGNSGSIFNWESVYNIREPGPWKVNAQFVSPPSAVVSNSTNQITVFVKDQNGNPLNGAEVKLNASAGSLDSQEKVTNSAGKATFTWTAPYADPDNLDLVNNGTKAIIQIETATYDDDEKIYDPAPGRLTLITVYPEDVPFLSVSMSADPDVIDPDYNNMTGTLGFTRIEVTVTDEAGNPVEGATVAVSVSPAIPDISPPEAVTDTDGKATFTLTATDLPDDDNTTLEYQVTAYAQSDDPDVKPGANSIGIFIVDRADAPPPQAEADYLGAPVVILVLLVTAAVFAIYRKKTSP